jgi:hypothetical protein
MNSGISKRTCGKRVGIIQSNYIPWKGYFDFISCVDEFILFDDVQYTRRDWRNRNKIKTKDGLKWLTVPVESKGNYFARVNEIRLLDHKWIDEHKSSLRHAYGRAPYFHEEWPWVESAYETCRKLSHLSDVNATFIHAICSRLGIGTAIRSSSEFEILEGKNERLISLCLQAGAKEYVSGPAAREYIDERLWSAAGISVSFKSYAGYVEYPQVHGQFEHGVTVLDLCFNVGGQAGKYYKSAIDVEPAA